MGVYTLRSMVVAVLRYLQFCGRNKKIRNSIFSQNSLKSIPFQQISVEIIFYRMGVSLWIIYLFSEFSNDIISLKSLGVYLAKSGVIERV